MYKVVIDSGIAWRIAHETARMLGLQIEGQSQDKSGRWVSWRIAGLSYGSADALAEMIRERCSFEFERVYVYVRPM